MLLKIPSLGFISDCYKMLLQLVHQPKHPFFRNGFVLHSNFASLPSETQEPCGLWSSQPRVWLRAVPLLRHEAQAMSANAPRLSS